MPIQFPSNPSLNQEYTYEGKVWRWDGVSWVGVRQETGIAEEKVWSKYLLQNPNRGTRLNSGYSYVTDQRRTKAGTIAASKHFMERRSGNFSSYPLLLDAYPDAAAAYSLRKIRENYTGPVVQVRRSNDNAELTFTAEEIENGTLAAWVGAGNNGFVKTWYDQSLNGRNVTQTTTSVQPQIVTSGALFTLNGKPAINWDSGSVNRRLTGTISTSTALSVHAVFSAVKRPSNYVKLFNIGADNTTQGYGYNVFAFQAFQDWQIGDATMLADGFESTRNARIVSRGEIFTSSETSQNLYFSSISSTAAQAFVNRAEIAYRIQKTGNTTTLTNTTLYVGNNDGNVQQFNGRMQELVFWTSNMLSSRTGIETESTNFYDIP